MNTQILIDSVVRQVTVLIAQLATTGGLRAPVAHVANQVFLDLTSELSAQGVSRKVSADMFGMALRAYVRKIRRLEEAQSDRGRTLWQAILDFIRQEQLVGRDRIIERFRLDGELEVTAILHDLTETGLVFTAGSGKGLVYRVTSDDELGRISELSSRDGLDEFVWVVVYREGPLAQARLENLLRRSDIEVSQILDRLIAAGRIERLADGCVVASSFAIPLGSSGGWEAAVFDHLQAVVQTICQRLAAVGAGAEAAPTVGGSTYTFDVWPGHPLEHEAKCQLDESRQRLGGLRQRLEAYNQEHGVPAEYQQVVTYFGQCVMEREREAQNGEV